MDPGTFGRRRPNIRSATCLREHMKCQRCLTNEVQYRAITDAMNIKICLFCAEEARKLGIQVEIFIPDTGAPRPDEPSVDGAREIHAPWF